MAGVRWVCSCRSCQPWPCSVHTPHRHANFSRELADFIVYVIDVCGGDKIPRKGGPGVTQADLLVINKIELADAVGADLAVMARDAKAQRESGPFVMANVKRGDGVPEIAEHVLGAWRDATGGKTKKAKT